MGRIEKDSALWKVHRETPLYTDLDIEYQQAYSGPYEPLDFGRMIVALKDNQITGYGRPAVGDLSKDECQRLYAISRDIYYMDFLFDGQLSNLSKFLLKKGYRPKPYYTQIIDLTQTEEKLHEGLRKSYAHLVNVGNQEMDISAFDKSNLRLLSPFEDLHTRVIGRQTRSLKTWAVQNRMIRVGQVFCVYAEVGDNLVAAAMIYYNEHTSYYGVACSLEGVSTHALLWKAILHAKSLGCKTFGLGEQVFAPTQTELPAGNYAGVEMAEGIVCDSKLVNISKFKRGFGGFTKARLIFK